MEKKPPTNSTSWPFELDHIHSFAYWENGFTKSECEQIIDIGNSYQQKIATMVEGLLEEKYRKSDVVFLFPSEETSWIFSRLTDIVTSLNNRYFQFIITGCNEGLQFTKYAAPGGRYGKHTDAMYNSLIRKLSFTLQLSDPADYEGGDLCCYYNEEPVVMKREQGYVSIFPSYVLHEVTPVTKGTRYSLVSWITGPSFR